MHYNLLSAKVVFFSQEAVFRNRIFGKLSLLNISTKTKNMKSARQTLQYNKKRYGELIRKGSHTAYLWCVPLFTQGCSFLLYKGKPCHDAIYFNTIFRLRGDCPWIETVNIQDRSAQFLRRGTSLPRRCRRSWSVAERLSAPPRKAKQQPAIQIIKKGDRCLPKIK